RSGKTHSWSGSDEWLFEGLVAMFIAMEARATSNRAQVVASVPPCEPYSRSVVQSAIDKVLSDAGTASEVFDVTPSNKDEIMAKVHSLFSGRRKNYKLDKLR